MSTTTVAPPAPSTDPSATPPVSPEAAHSRLPRSLWWLLIAMAIALVGGTVLVQALTPTQNDVSLPQGTSLSAAPDGTLALFRWLTAENYRVTRVQEFPFSQQGLDMLVVITPRAVDFTDGDITDVMEFVDAGGTLLLVSDGSNTTRALEDALGLNVSYPKNAVANTTAMPAGVTLARPPVRSVTVQSPSVVQPALLNDARFLPRATNRNGVVVASLIRGAGRVHIITDNYPVTNAGLPEADNLALIQNLITGLPPNARIGFDEYHHGFGKGSAIADLALRSPWGWTIIYLAALLLTVFTLNGRRFGKPLMPPPAPAPAPAEFTRALSDRWRERGQYAFAQTHLADDLKRAVGAAFSLDPTAEDWDFLAALHAARPDLAPECQALLGALRMPVDKDATLVALARRVESLTERATGGTVVQR